MLRKPFLIGGGFGILPLIQYTINIFNTESYEGVANQTTQQGQNEFKSKVRTDHPPDDVQLIRTSVCIVKKVIMIAGEVRHPNIGMSFIVENNDIVGPTSAENMKNFIFNLFLVQT